jgi:acetyl/propionyl-CoA carboxylase alpha subunit
MHPGCCLSENAAFAKTVKDAGAVFKDLQSYATEMGDKLLSKQLMAARCGVNIIQLCEVVVSGGTRRTVCNGLWSNISTVKAPPEAGGKNMRVCYNDQDGREAWGVATGEAKKKL